MVYGMARRYGNSLCHPDSYRGGHTAGSDGESVVNQRGMVLVAVLWVVLVISLIAFSLAASVRVQAESELNGMDSDKAFYMAKGAAETVYARFVAKEEFPKDS